MTDNNHLLKELSGGRSGDPSPVYLELWCRNLGQGNITVSDEQECAYAAGCDGNRAVRTWKERMYTPWWSSDSSWLNRKGTGSTGRCCCSTRLPLPPSSMPRTRSSRNDGRRSSIEPTTSGRRSRRSRRFRARHPPPPRSDARHYRDGFAKSSASY
jgi:hypothetical protein